MVGMKHRILQQTEQMNAPAVQRITIKWARINQKTLAQLLLYYYLNYYLERNRMDGMKSNQIKYKRNVNSNVIFNRLCNSPLIH